MKIGKPGRRRVQDPDKRRWELKPVPRAVEGRGSSKGDE